MAWDCGVNRRRLGILVAVFCAVAVVASAAPMGNLLDDPGFDKWRPEAAGKWEVRYAHRGGNYPNQYPEWTPTSMTDAKAPEHGRYFYTGDGKMASGSILLGQRVRVPEKPANMSFSVDFQCYCANKNRSGAVDLAIYSPKVWDAMARDGVKATKLLVKGDVMHVAVKRQGDDVTTWQTAQALPPRLSRSLKQVAGKEVVVAVVFSTWHKGAEEWARYDNIWFGGPVSFVRAAGWPRYIYEDEPVALRVQGLSREEGGRFELRYRPAGAREWQAAEMRRVDNGVYEATIPASLTAAPVEAQATLLVPGAAARETDVATMALTRRPTHPNMFYNRAELDAMRKKIDKYPWAKEAWQQTKEAADKWLTGPFEPQVISGGWWHNYTCADCGSRLTFDPDKPHAHVCRACGKVWDTPILYSVWWSGVHGRYMGAAQSLAMAYQMTGEKKYARRAIEILTWYADHYAAFPVADRGGKVRSQTLSESSWLLSVMNAADLAYGAMTPEEARHIERDLIYAGALYTRKYKGKIHNIRCWHNACWAAAGYFLGDPDLVEIANNGKYGFRDQMEQGVLEDGMWYERSMGYHNYMVMAISRHLEAAMHHGDDLYKMPQVRKLFLFPLMITFPDMVPPSLNDGGFSMKPIGVSPLERAVAWYGDPVAAGALRKRYSEGLSRANGVAWHWGEELPEAEYVAPPSADLSGAGLAVLRSGEGKSATCAMIEYGEHGGGHGHPDKLQLLFYGLERQLCPDLGTTGYANPMHHGYYKTTPGHNTVTIGGVDMKKKSGEMLDFQTGDGWAASAVRSTEVYPGYTLTRRTLLKDGVLVDEFTVEGAKADTLDWFLRSDGSMKLDVSAKPLSEKPLGTPYTYMKDWQGAETAGDWSAAWTYHKRHKGRLVVTMQGAPGTLVARCKAPGPAGSMWHTLRVRRQAAKTRFVAAFQVLEQGEKPAAVRFDGDTVRVGDVAVSLSERAKAPRLVNAK